MSDLVLWSKPSCVQCDMVKRRIVEKIAGKTGLSMVAMKAAFRELVAAGVVIERDLTSPDSAKDLDYFRGLGYQAAPITEHGGSLVPGYSPAELDVLIAAWRSERAEEVPR